MQGIFRAGNAGSADVTGTTTTRFLPRMVTGLAVAKFELMRCMIERHRAAVPLEHHDFRFLSRSHRAETHKQTGHQ